MATTAAACLTYKSNAQVVTNTKQTNGGAMNLFSASSLEKLESIMISKRVKAGSSLFWEGDLAGKLYYVRSGSVKLTRTSEEGRDFILSIVKKGDLFGEVEDSPEAVQTYSAEAIVDTEIGVIPLSDLENLLYQHGDFAVEFTKWLGLMHRTMQTKLRDLLLFGKPGALASTLIRMSNTYGVETDNGIKLSLRLSNSEMADMIGATRESVNRMLSSMKDEGTIAVQQGQIVIKQIDNLRRMCNCPQFPSCPKEICRI